MRCGDVGADLDVGRLQVAVNDALLFEVVDARDVGMVERGEHLRLALEPGEPVGVLGERLGLHLQRHVAVELRVVGLVDLSHAAFADLGGDLVDAERTPWIQRHAVLNTGWLYGRLVELTDKPGRRDDARITD